MREGIRTRTLSRTYDSEPCCIVVSSECRVMHQVGVSSRLP
jgi:hypothetical protein